MSSRMRRICVTLLCLCHPVFLAMAAEGRPLVGLVQMSDRTGVPFNIGLQLRCLSLLGLRSKLSLAGIRQFAIRTTAF